MFTKPTEKRVQKLSFDAEKEAKGTETEEVKAPGGRRCVYWGKREAGQLTVNVETCPRRQAGHL